jgi:hypothetical protein
MNAKSNPLIGTPLHRCLLALEEAQTHMGDDLKSGTPEEMAALADGDIGIADAMACVRAELNRRYAAMRAAAVKRAPSKTVAQVELRLPGPAGTKPVYFDKTARGVGELFDFIAQAMPDGGAAIVAMNHTLLDRLAEAGFKNHVKDLRDAAREILNGHEEAAE